MIAKVRAIKQELWLTLTLIFIELVAYRNWLLSFSILSKGDWSYFYKQAMSSLQINYFSLWLSDYSFGRVLIDAGQAPTYAMYGVYAKYLGLSFPVSERLIYMWPVLVVTPIAMYTLLRLVVRQPLAKFVGVCAYSFNTYFMLLQSGGMTLAGAWAFAPLVIYYFIKTLRANENRLRNIIFTSLYGAICSAYEPRVFYIVIWILIFYTLTYAFFLDFGSTLKAKLQRLVRLGVIAALPLFIIIFLDCFWILGLAAVKGQKGQGIIASALWGSGFYNIQEAMTLFHPFWQSPGNFIVQNIPMYAWLIPLFAILGLYFNKRNKTVIFFGFIACIGILLTKQVDQPFKNLYEWLFHNLPGFNAFREASKFYGMIAIGYAVLIAAFIEKVIVNKQRLVWRNINFAYIIAAIACLIFIVNLYPQAIKNKGNLIEARHIPQDYLIFKNFLDGDPEFSRVYWLPKFSRWSFYDATHPKVSDQSNVFGLTNDLPTDLAQTVHGAIFDQNYARSYFKKASIKYVAIPIQDIANKDNFFFDQDRQAYIRKLDQVSWLKRLNIGTKDLAVYENTDIDPYFRTSLHQNVIPDSDQTQTYFNFQLATNKSNQDDFIAAADNKMDFTSIPVTVTTDVFGDIKKEDFDNGKINADPAHMPSNRSNNLYANTSKSYLTYQINSGVLSIFTNAQNSLLLNSKPIAGNSSIQTYHTNLNKDGNYAISVDNQLLPLDQTSNALRNIGSDDKQVSIYSVGKQNLLPQGNFDKLWSGQVEDCNNYDNGPEIDMTLNKSKITTGNPALWLIARKHIACTTSQAIKVTSDASYSISYKFAVEGTQKEGYDLLFNDPKHTTVHDEQLVGTDKPQALYKKFIVPAGATTVKVRLRAVPDVNGGWISSTYYDDVSIRQLSLVDKLTTSSAPLYKGLKLSNGDQLQASTANSGGANLVSDASFENGLWQQKVGDCNAYDAEPNIYMRLSPIAHQGNNSLELGATKHAACLDSKPINVKEKSEYFLSFWVQSETSKQAKYSVRFNDPAATNYSGLIKISSHAWQNFSTKVDVPYGATQMIITAYSFSDESGNNTSINRYDDFYFAELPDISNRYFLVSTPSNTLQSPRKITFQHNKPTYKKIQVSGATTGFFLMMSESYQSDWRLEIDNAATHGMIGWLPFGLVHAVPSSQHFKSNNFQNSWYVDVDNLCNKAHYCDKNPDGSYNIKLVAEFAPQRWFNFGVLVSCATLLGCFILIGYSYVKPLRHKANRLYIMKGFKNG